MTNILSSYKHMRQLTYRLATSWLVTDRLVNKNCIFAYKKGAWR